MNFIFPQNYQFNSKLFGLIDYQSAIVIVILIGSIFCIINTFISTLNLKIFIFITTSLPILIFSIIGINGENIINYTFYMVKFISRRKVIFYNKK